MHTNKVYVAKMGIGMIMPGIVEDLLFGHMWVYWTKGEDEHYPAYRGYYPLRGDIPPSALESRVKMLRFFARNSVRGRYQVDFLARDLMENVGEKIFKKEWNITKRQLEHLKNICQVPEEQIYVLEGRYSWNSKHSGCNKCVLGS